MSLSTHGRSALRFLIILPEHTTESELAKRFILAMRNALGPVGESQIRILGFANVGNLINMEGFHDFLFFTEADLNRWGLPGKELNWACQRIQVDAVLDLNQAFAPISATICGQSTKALIAPIGLYLPAFWQGFCPSSSGHSYKKTKTKYNTSVDCAF